MSSESTLCTDITCRQSTYNSAWSGHLECLRYAHDSLGASCDWHPRTTYGAAMNGHLECLVYIYEKCGDVAT